MSDYELLTTWRIDVPLDRVWETIQDADTWPEWWKGVLKVTKIQDGAENGVGSIRRTTWKRVVPYTLEFDSEIMRVEHERYIEVRAFGELDGAGIWHFMSDDPLRTRVDYNWQVRTTKSWMNALAPIAKPIFRLNHNSIMRWVEKGLRRRLQS